MKIKIKKLVEEAVIPKYATDGDACMDLTAVSKTKVDEGDHGYTSYGIGLALEIPKGYVGIIYPRSSISKTGLIMANSVGVIDSGYRGEISARFKHIPNTADYNVGDRVAQIMIIHTLDIEFEESEELNKTERGEGGFGSTGT